MSQLLLLKLNCNNVNCEGKVLQMSYERFEPANEGLLKTSTKNLDQYFSGGHIECNTVTLRHLLMSFVHTLYQQVAGKNNVHQDLFQMDQFYQMSALHVRCDGSLQLHHMTS